MKEERAAKIFGAIKLRFNIHGESGYNRVSWSNTVAQEKRQRETFLGNNPRMRLQSPKLVGKIIVSTIGGWIFFLREAIQTRMKYERIIEYKCLSK